MEPLHETTPLMNKWIYDIPACSKVRITTENCIVEGTVIKNPKVTGTTDWVEIAQCVYLKPQTWGTKRLLSYNKSEIVDLKILKCPIPLATQPKALVMNTFVVTKQNQFTNVMDSLQVVNRVGLALHGKQAGRAGTIGWVVLNIRGNLICIDILRMGTEENQIQVWATLKERLFENNLILKVVHDVRPIADYLYHKHVITLKNVFDTQLAEFYINVRKNREEFELQRETSTKHIKGLNHLDELMSKYLSNVAHPEEITMYESFRNGYSKNESILVRPFKIDENAKGIALSVKFLLRLHTILADSLLDPFRTCVTKQMCSIIDGDLLDMINFLGKPELVSKYTVDLISSQLSLVSTLSESSPT